MAAKKPDPKQSKAVAAREARDAEASRVNMPKLEKGESVHVADENPTRRRDLCKQLQRRGIPHSVGKAIPADATCVLLGSRLLRPRELDLILAREDLALRICAPSDEGLPEAAAGIVLLSPYQMRFAADKASK